MKYVKFYEEFIYHNSDDKLNLNIGNRNNIYHRQLEISKLEFERSYTDNDWSEILEILKNDCSEFLNEIKSDEIDPIWRGVKNKDEIGTPGIWTKTPYSNRKNLDTPNQLSDDMNDLFIDKFGIPIRSNGVFVTKSPQDASTYSDYKADAFRIKKDDRYYDLVNSTYYSTGRKTPYMVFPIGDYKYFWNESIVDLYSDNECHQWFYDYENYDYNFYDDWYDLYSDPIDNKFSEKKGIFSFNDITTHRFNNIESFKTYILENPDDFGYKGDSDFDDSEFKWIPELTFEDYKKINLVDPKDELYKIVDGYKDSGLKYVENQEVVFVCDKYYLVAEAFYPNLLKYIKG